MGSANTKGLEDAASKRLLKDYAPGQILGEGTFGVVYACTHRESNQEFAIKMLAIDKVENPISEIRAEAELLKSMDCKQIIKVHEIYYEWYYVFMVMDKFSGGDLVAGLHRHLRRKGKIPCCEIVHIGYQMASALEYIHARSVVHRDVKGDNYLMSVKNITDPNNVVALSDFGSATTIKAGERLHSEVGTKIFWSPEFYKKSYGMKVDVWAMGVTMYGLLDGCFPFKDDKEIMNTEPILPSCIHADCGDYLQGMLTKNEEKRLSSAQVVAHSWMSNKDREKGKDVNEGGGLESPTGEAFGCLESITSEGFGGLESITSEGFGGLESITSEGFGGLESPFGCLESITSEGFGGLDSITSEGFSRGDAGKEMEVNKRIDSDRSTWDSSSTKDTSGLSLDSAPFKGASGNLDTSDVTAVKHCKLPVRRARRLNKAKFSTFDTSGTKYTSGLSGEDASGSKDMSGLSGESAPLSSASGDLDTSDVTAVKDCRLPVRRKKRLDKNKFSTWDTSSTKDTSGLSEESAPFNDASGNLDTSDDTVVKLVSRRSIALESLPESPCTSPVHRSKAGSYHKWGIYGAGPILPSSPVFSPKHAASTWMLSYIWKRTRSLRGSFASTSPVGSNARAMA